MRYLFILFYYKICYMGGMSMSIVMLLEQLVVMLDFKGMSC